MSTFFVKSQKKSQFLPISFSTEAVEPAEHGSPGTESPGKYK